MLCTSIGSRASLDCVDANYRMTDFVCGLAKADVVLTLRAAVLVVRQFIALGVPAESHHWAMVLADTACDVVMAVAHAARSA